MDVQMFEDNDNDLPPLLDKVLSSLQESDTTDANIYLYLAVLYVVLETGFCVDDAELTEIYSYDYDLRTLNKSVELLPNNLFKQKEWSSANTFKFLLRLGLDGKAVLIGNPSSESQKPYLTVNIYIQKPNFLSSCSFETSEFVSLENGKVTFKSRKKFSLLVKDKLAVPAKQTILRYYCKGCFPHLMGLPDHVVEKIVAYLPRVRHKNNLFEACSGRRNFLSRKW